ncbi:MAG: tetratricopeptide repeat protein [Candidatus Omnitrophota bacterium]
MAEEIKEVPMIFNRRFGKIAAVVLLCFFARPLECSADKVFLKSGQEEEGRIVEKTLDYVVLYTNGVLKVHPAGEIVRIVKAELSNPIPAQKQAEQASVDGQTSNVCTSTDACCMLGNTALLKGESDRAIKFFDDAIRYDPQNTNAYDGRGRARLMGGTKNEDPKAVYLEALKDANEAVRLAPSSASGWVLRARVLRKLGRPDETIVDCEKAIAFNPHSSGAYSERGAAYNAKGDYDSAISDFSKVIALAQAKSPLKWALIQRATCYLKKGDIARAEIDCDRAFQIDPVFGDAYAVRAKVCAARKEYDRAWAEVQKAQELGAIVDPVFLEELKKNLPPS